MFWYYNPHGCTHIRFMSESSERIIKIKNECQKKLIHSNFATDNTSNSVMIGTQASITLRTIISLKKNIFMQT